MHSNNSRSAWDLNGDSVFDLDSPAVVVSWETLVILGVLDSGNRSVTLRVTDPDAEASTTTVDWTIHNLPPDLQITPSENVTLVEGETLHVTAAATDLPADTISIAWTITRGGSVVATGNGSTLDYMVPDQGSYEVTFTATDDELWWSTASLSVSVTNKPPVGRMRSSTDAREGVATTLQIDSLNDVTADLNAGLLFGF